MQAHICPPAAPVPALATHSTLTWCSALGSRGRFAFFNPCPAPVTSHDVHLKFSPSARKRHWTSSSIRLIVHARSEEARLKIKIMFLLA